MWFSFVKKLQMQLRSVLPVTAERRGSGGRRREQSVDPFKPVEYKLWYERITAQGCTCDGASKCPPNGSSVDSECPLVLGLPPEYLTWAKALIEELDGLGCAALRTLYNYDIPLHLALILIYNHLRIAVEDAKDAFAIADNTKQFSKAHTHTRGRWESLRSSLEVYQNCSAQDEKKYGPFFEPMSSIHEMRRPLLEIAEAALTCLGQLDEWTADAINPAYRASLTAFLHAKILPATIENDEVLGKIKWWAEAEILLQTGLEVMLNVASMGEDKISKLETEDLRKAARKELDQVNHLLSYLSFDAETLRKAARKNQQEGEHMLSYLSIPRYDSGDQLAQACWNYMQSLPAYKVRMSK